MYKPEYTLGLIGAILCTVVAALLLIALIFVLLFAGTAGGILDAVLQDVQAPHIAQGALGIAAGVVAIIIGACFALSAAAAVLGYMGAARLEREDKTGGVMLIVAAGLSLISVMSFVPMVLLLIGGILSLTRKPARL